MEIKIKHNDVLHTYEGSSLIFAIEREERIEGGFMGSNISFMAMLIELIKECLKDLSAAEQVAFFATLAEEFCGKAVKVEEVDHA